MYKKIVLPSNAWQNGVGLAVPRWLTDDLAVLKVENLHVTVNILVTFVDNTSILLNSGDWIVKDGDTLLFYKYLNAVFVTKYSPIP